MPKADLVIKRTADFLLSLIGVVLTSPLLAVIAIGVKASSKGPVIFKQKRLGLNGGTFEIYKFRTMVPNAEKMGAGVVVNEKSDSRITGIGKFLRASSLDELPQLINVLKGDMSLVGPRPPVTYHPYNGYDSYPSQAKRRFDMRPGMTGLAQVELPVDATWEERIEADIMYVDDYSLLLDLGILGRTVGAVLHRGSY
ncbi:sugar transferase [Parvibacter caecicola]|uniref:sugar transferase n=1 Tax=Parvibacter caecicola TaxID=747645 RepID=UPI002731F02B|nr:sugar transferase [Parvibacter caecicola]